MFDFGLKPCPLCGGEAEVARLTQGPEECSAVIRCTGCGLTLDWRTKIKVGVSRSGKHTAVEVGPDPIEAWNRREMCQGCADKRYAKMMIEMPNCNDCGVADCPHMPACGESVRLNCPLWRPMEEKDEKETENHASI